MKTGKEEYDQSLLDSLEKKYQLFLDSPNGEINVYLVLSKNDEDSKSEISHSSKNIPVSNNIYHTNPNNHSNFNNFTTGNNNVNQFNTSGKPFTSSGFTSNNTNNNILQPNRSFKNIQKNSFNDNEMII